MFYSLALLGVVVYLTCMGLTIFLSNRNETTKEVVFLHSLLQYVCLSSLSFAFIAWLLGLQESGDSHPISTFNDSGFITDLMVLSTMFVIVLVYNVRFIGSFCKPIFKVDIVGSLHNFILYLRPFDTDDNGFETILKQFEKKTFKAISIANPHSVIQNSFSDKVFADDSEWKSAVLESMNKSAFTILNVGDTKGCLWELEQCSEQNIGKTIFLVTNESSYKVFCAFVEKLCEKISLPKYNEGIVEAYFLESPSNCYSWHHFHLSQKEDVERIINDFLQERVQISNKIKDWEKSKKSPYSSIFDDKIFPQNFGWLSLSGLSLISFPFMGRIRWTYWITLLPLTIVMFLIFKVYALYIMFILLSIFGKRIIWLSSKWSGTKAVNAQINLIGITTVICIALSYILGKMYLNIYPIVHDYLYF